MRVAIAEDQGWTNIHHAAYETWHNDSGTMSGLIGKSPDKQAWPELQLPNYPEDLNAMHEVEKSLPEETNYAWIKCISEACGCNALPDLLTPTVIIARATALQRAEAYLRTKGLWKE